MLGMWYGILLPNLPALSTRKVQRAQLQPRRAFSRQAYGNFLLERHDTFRFEAWDPFGHRLGCGVEPAGRETGIVVCPFGALAKSLTLGDISLPGSHRMDNLLKIHS
jgi:hypothetical protein